MDAIALGLTNNLSIETKRQGWNLPKGPKYRVYQSAVSTYGNKIYVSGGQQSESRPWLQIFDPSAGSWETLPLPVHFYNHAQVTLGDFIYLVANQNSMGEHRRYNLSTKTFTTRTGPIQPLYAATAEANPDLGVYNLFGGENAGYRSENQQYDPVTNTWSYKASMPIPARWVNAHYYDGNFYVWGGFNGSYPNQVQIYNPSTNLWSYGPNNAPTQWTQNTFSQSIRFGNKVFQKSHTSNIYVFDLETLTFSERLHTYGGHTEEYSLGAAINNKLYWIGGNTGYYFYQTVVYDPFADEWPGLRENDSLYGHALSTDFIDKIWLYNGRTGFTSASYFQDGDDFYGRRNFKQYTISTETWTDLNSRPSSGNSPSGSWENPDTHEFLLYNGTPESPGNFLYTNEPVATSSTADKSTQTDNYLRYTIATNAWDTSVIDSDVAAFGTARHTAYATDPITGFAWQAGAGRWTTGGATDGFAAPAHDELVRNISVNDNFEHDDLDYIIGNAIGAYRNKILVVGALNASNEVTPIGNCRLRDHALNTLTNVEPIPIKVAYAQYAAINDKVYIMGGVTQHFNVWQTTHLVQVFDLLSFTWSFGTPLPRGLAYGRAVGIGNKIYLYGGYHKESGTLSNQLIVYDTEESERIVGIENLKNYLVTV